MQTDKHMKSIVCNLIKSGIIIKISDPTLIEINVICEVPFFYKYNNNS